MTKKNSFGALNQKRRIAISGTFGVGKSTLAQLLSQKTGIPTTKAKQMRQILSEHCPGKTLKQCDPTELCKIFFTRFIERKAAEEKLSDIGFISDGSSLNEWAYLYGRTKHGAHGPNSTIIDSNYDFAAKLFGELVKNYVSNAYTDVVHVPQEFPIPEDGYRPSSQQFRDHVDSLILDAWNSIGVKVHVVTGSVEQRLLQIIELFGLEISSTGVSPIVKGDVIWYERIEDVLGDPQERYFTSGYKKVKSYLYDVHVNRKTLEISARADLVFPSQWSLKKGVSQSPHFTNIDALLIMGQLAQLMLFTQDNIERAQSNNMWVRNVRIINLKPIRELTGIPVSLKQVGANLTKLENRAWRLATMVGSLGNGALKVSDYKLCYELPNHLQYES
jgi:hypothetical protein